MKHYLVLTLRWSKQSWPTKIKEPIEGYWLQPAVYKLKHFKIQAEAFIS